MGYCHPGTQELQLGLPAVTEIDSAGLQLLLKAEAQQRGFTQRLFLHSEADGGFELLKLGMYFGDPIDIPANWKKS